MSHMFFRLVQVMNAVGSTLVLFIMVVVLTDVIGRTLFNVPLSGTFEIVSMAVAVIVFLQIPNTLAIGRVIAADGLLGWLGRQSIRAQQWVLAFHHFVGAVIFAVMGWYLAQLLATAWQTGDYYGHPVTFAFPKWPVFSVILFGSIIMSIQYALLTWQFLKSGYRRHAWSLREQSGQVVL